MSQSLIADTDRSSHISNARRVTPPFAALRAFDAVGKLGGLRRAALHLGVDHAVISRHLRALESFVGVALVDRLQSGGRLTVEGERYHARVSAAFAEINAATAELMQADGNVKLRIWCIHGIASLWLAPHMGEFCEDNPDIEIEVQPSDAAPNFANHEADADIRYIAGLAAPIDLAPGLQCTELARPEVIAVASPRFLASHPPILEMSDFLNVPMLHKKDDDHWRHWLEAKGMSNIGPLAGLRLWQNDITVQAARNGQGVALGNAFLLGDDLETGRLVKIDVGPPVTLGAYFFTTRADRWNSPALARLRRWLQRAATMTRKAH
jgi:DNA-binding transcriptional LysR family regulator